MKDSAQTICIVLFVPVSGFNSRMAALQDSDVEELTSSLMAGLKSWLSMGLAMAPMSGWVR